MSDHSSKRKGKEIFCKQTIRIETKKSFVHEMRDNERVIRNIHLVITRVIERRWLSVQQRCAYLIRQELFVSRQEVEMKFCLSFDQRIKTA